MGFSPKLFKSTGAFVNKVMEKVEEGIGNNRVFPQVQGFEEQQGSSSWNKSLSGLEKFSAAILKIGYHVR